MKNPNKRFANIILIALVVVLAGALGYMTLVKKSVPVEQQPSIRESMQDANLVPIVTKNTLTQIDTTDWQMHVNHVDKDRNFSFKYPKTWTVLDTLNINTCCLDLINLENFNWSDENSARFRAPGVMKAQFGYSGFAASSNKQEFINKMLAAKQDDGIPSLPIDGSSFISLPNENGFDVMRYKGGCCGNINYVIPIKKDFSEAVSISVWHQDPMFEKILSTINSAK